MAAHGYNLEIKQQRIVCAKGFIDTGTWSEYLSPLESGKARPRVDLGLGCVGRHQDSPGNWGFRLLFVPNLLCVLGPAT